MYDFCGIIMKVHRASASMVLRCITTEWEENLHREYDRVCCHNFNMMGKYCDSYCGKNHTEPKSVPREKKGL